MKFYPQYSGSSPDLGCAPFPASVPGNIQLDYIRAHPEFIGDIHYGLEHRKMAALEPYTWYYTAVLDYTLEPGEKLWFVTEGIDYLWSLLIDGEEFYSHEGMFSRVELCLTDLLGEKLHPGASFAVKIHPHPMLAGEAADRGQARQSVKPPVSYGWDWHPRVIPSGIWDDTYFITRTDAQCCTAEARYVLSDDLRRADVTLRVRCADEAQVEVRDPSGAPVFTGKVSPEHPEAMFTLTDPVLWWCRGLGEPSLYSYTVRAPQASASGTFGVRRTRLVMNEGAWQKPDTFPKTRSVPPIQLELNGVKVFAKGSNYVSQEMFPGTMTAEKYERSIKAAAECGMNIFRCWGGSGVQKEAFYDLCDRYGLMLWVEFPLACNNYFDSEHYLTVLRREAQAIIARLSRHPSVVLWCGGNELFNAWSGMTDQHLALRLLNALTLEMTPEIPFIPTSPLMGMKHGGYTFLDPWTEQDPFALFGSAEATAYVEFGIPGVSPAQTIRSIIPEDERFPPRPGADSAWQAHHAYGAWDQEPETWLCFGTLERFGDVSTLERMIETSDWLQGIGYKAIFEAARRQKPYCSMAINWCWCEPWKCAANNSLIAYPDIRKPAYDAVRDSLRDVLGTAEIPKFAWAPGQTLTVTPWLLNDTREAVRGSVTLSVTFGGRTETLGTAELEAAALTNAHGAPMSFRIPDTAADKERFAVTATLTRADGSITENTFLLVVKHDAP